MKYTLSLKNDVFFNENDFKSAEKYLELGFEKYSHYDDVEEDVIIIFKSYPSIEINTLDELHDFINKYGRILIDKNSILICND